MQATTPIAMPFSHVRVRTAAVTVQARVRLGRIPAEPKTQPAKLMIVRRDGTGARNLTSDSLNAGVHADLPSRLHGERANARARFGRTRTPM
ncbi:MAG: hypothetical protein ABIR58_01410 [Gemmatimonadaceae bacterium]